MRISNKLLQTSNVLILGCYLRRLIVYFEELTFSQVAAFYEAFKVYYSSCEGESDSHALRCYDSMISAPHESVYEDNCTHPGAW